MSTFSLSRQPYYNSSAQCYTDIIVVDRQPTGALASICRRIQLPLLSPFQALGQCERYEPCKYAVLDPENRSELLNPMDIARLYSYLHLNSCTIDTALTQMTFASPGAQPSGLLCFITVP